jgi:hypothetical protein
MTFSPTSVDTESIDWQTRYKAKDAHDADSKRSDSISLLQVAGIVISSVFATTYLWSQNQEGFTNWFGANGILWGGLIIIVLAIIAFRLTFSTFFKLATDLFIKLYQPPDGTKPAERIRLRYYGIPPYPPALENLPSPLDKYLNYPFVIIKEGHIDPQGDWISWLGGPARLVIFDGNAVYVERGDRFSRVIGPASHLPFLDASERVKAVVDLRPQILTKPGSKPGGVRAWTKDGIQVQLDVRLECQIGLEGMTEATSKGLLFPYGPISVRKAIERMAVHYDRNKKCLAESDWADGVWGQVQGMLATYVFSHTVDELFLAESGPDQIFSQEVTAKWLQDMNKKLKGYGTRLVSLQITNVTPVSPTVNVQREKAWEAKKQSAAVVNEGQAKAFGILAYEKARAEAERDLIDAIVEGLRKTRPSKYNEQLVLSLSGIMDQSLKDTDFAPYIPSQTLESLEKLRVLLKL